ncbi:sel1 repeat family protein [Chryseobacterium taklimakanense]|uniref:Sel1 repeat family protein n=1 Tax=Chryseobacterium taklimakanense TaxID=536441 RepID=A0A3G8WMG3_9FLAO|nr:sel1 repeat family protein [Chryseobacterium taklimakanense]AZI20667.1 sel1 repeat family protein [Chryseobacterium taklimakanense]
MDNSNIPLSNNQDTAKVIVDTASVFQDNKIEEYHNNVITKGDALSFTKLIIHYEEKSDYKELQKYALIMADKYNSGDGCSQVFVNIVAMNNNNEYYDISDFAKINNKAKNEALKYLEKGAKLNDIDCMSMLSDIYRNGIGVEKDVKKADELKRKIENL